MFWWLVLYESKRRYESYLEVINNSNFDEIDLFMEKVINPLEEPNQITSQDKID